MCAQMEDSGALPIEMPVDNLHMGDVIDIFPYQGVAKMHGSDKVVAEFKMKTDVLFDEVPCPRPRSTLMCDSCRSHIIIPGVVSC